MQPILGLLAPSARRVSVILPVKNGRQHIGQALRSIVQNVCADDELIVIDDASTDGTAFLVDEVLRRLQPSFSVRMIAGLGKGPAVARNQGLRLAKGEFIAFLDHDDHWPDNRVAAHVAVLQSARDVAVVMGKTQYVDESVDESTKGVLARATGLGDAAGLLNVGDAVQGQVGSRGLASQPSRPPGFLPDPHYHVHLGASTFVRTVFESVGVFDEELRFSEDHDLFLRIREMNLRIHPVEATGLYYRIHQTNMTRSKQLQEMQLFTVIQKSLRRRREQGAILSPFPQNVV